MIKRFPLEQILFILEIIEFQKPFKYFFFKLGKMLSDLLMPCLILFILIVFAQFRNEIERVIITVIETT